MRQQALLHDGGARQFVGLARVFRGLGGGAGPAEEGTDAGLEFLGAKRLDEVVVRAGVQAREPVQFISACREHQDVGVGEFPEAAADFHAVEVGEVDVQGDQFGVGVLDCFDAGGPICGFRDDEIQLLKDNNEEAADILIIFNDDGMTLGRR